MLSETEDHIKMKKRILAAVLTAVLTVSLAVSLAACADGKQNTTTAAGVTDTTPEKNDDGSVTKPSLGVNFSDDGENTDVKFAVAEADADGFHKRSIGADDYNAENDVDVAVRTRNQRISEELGVNIVMASYSDDSIRSSSVRDSLMAQDDTYDVICGLQWADCQLVLDACLADLTMLEDNKGNPIDYINFNAPYWSTYYIDAMKCGNAIFWLTGDLCLRYTGGFYCFFVNTELYNETLYNEYGSIYDVVKSGKWTYDTLSDMVAKAFRNNDGDESKVTREDQLGLSLTVWDNINGMSVAAGVEYCSRGDDGTITNTFNSKNTTLINFCKKVRDLASSGYVYTYTKYKDGMYEDSMVDLMSNAVFTSGRLNQAELYLQNMNEYAIIPCPKLTESQSYRSSVHDAVQLYGINAFSSNIPAAAATLEYMAYYSYVDVRPVYYDSALKYRYTTDEVAAEMIDLMGESVYSDFMYIWQFCPQMSEMGNLLRSYATSKVFSSIIAKKENAYNAGLEEIVTELKKLGY